MSIRLALDTSRLQELTGNVRPVAQELVAKTAFEVQAQAQVFAPVDTGALRASISAEQQAALRWWVQDGVEYGIYQEFGTSRMAAQPFLTPAVEARRADFEQAFAELFK